MRRYAKFVYLPFLLGLQTLKLPPSFPGRPEGPADPGGHFIVAGLQVQNAGNEPKF